MIKNSVERVRLAGVVAGRQRLVHQEGDLALV
jgi:hypothetical protein